LQPKKGNSYVYDGLSIETGTLSSWKEHLIQWAKDFQRSVDYLENRTDINHDKLAYFGVSWSASFRPYILPLEGR